jgi:uncharacterized membrane protein YebE (DUF533 family)
MAETQFLSVIRLWAALAWADGVVKPAEATALRRLIDAAELTDDERVHAQGFLARKVELDPTNLEGLSVDSRQGIYRAACRLAAVDRDVADVERSFLAALRSALAVAPDAAEHIETAVFGKPI